MFNKNEIFTNALLKHLNELSFPHPVTKRNFSRYLQGFKTQRIIFENSAAGKPIAAFTIFLLFAKFPQMMAPSVRDKNRDVLLKLENSLQFDEGLELNHHANHRR